MSSVQIRYGVLTSLIFGFCTDLCIWLRLLIGTAERCWHGGCRTAYPKVRVQVDASFCVDCLEEAIRNYGTPEVFNTDQGSQFTSDSFTGVLTPNGIAISMDGHGRALDNIFVERLWRTVKHEDVYLKGYETMPTLLLGLTDYFLFYNEERRHQSLGYATPDVVYRTATGGGAKIVDRFGSVPEVKPPAEELGQRQPAAV